MHDSPRATPLVVHFNGPAKVIFEGSGGGPSARPWRLPWDAEAGRTPVAHMVAGIRGSFDAHTREAAVAAFERNVTFLDTHLQRAEPPGPLRSMCEVPPGPQPGGRSS